MQLHPKLTAQQEEILEELETLLEFQFNRISTNPILLWGSGRTGITTILDTLIKKWGVTTLHTNIQSWYPLGCRREETYPKIQEFLVDQSKKRSYQFELPPAIILIEDIQQLQVGNNTAWENSIRHEIEALTTSKNSNSCKMGQLTPDALHTLKNHCLLIFTGVWNTEENSPPIETSFHTINSQPQNDSRSQLQRGIPIGIQKSLTPKTILKLDPPKSKNDLKTILQNWLEEAGIESTTQEIHNKYLPNLLEASEKGQNPLLLKEEAMHGFLLDGPKELKPLPSKNREETTKAHLLVDQNTGESLNLQELVTIELSQIAGCPGTLKITDSQQKIATLSSLNLYDFLHLLLSRTAPSTNSDLLYTVEPSEKANTPKPTIQDLHPDAIDG